MLSSILFWGYILLVLFVSWKLERMLLKKSFSLAAVVAVMTSGLLVGAGGYYWYLVQPDLIAKGISVFVYTVSFVIITLVVLTRPLFAKNVNMLSK